MLLAGAANAQGGYELLLVIVILFYALSIGLAFAFWKKDEALPPQYSFLNLGTWCICCFLFCFLGMIGVAFFYCFAVSEIEKKKLVSRCCRPRATS